MSETSTVTVYVFSRLNTIMTAFSACNAFTVSRDRDARHIMFIIAAPPFAAISMTITSSELQ